MIPFTGYKRLWNNSTDVKEIVTNLWFVVKKESFLKRAGLSGVFIWNHSTDGIIPRMDLICFCAEESIAKVSKARNDKLFCIKFWIYMRDDNCNFRESFFLRYLDPLGRR